MYSERQPREDSGGVTVGKPGEESFGGWEPEKLRGVL